MEEEEYIGGARRSDFVVRLACPIENDHFPSRLPLRCLPVYCTIK